LISQRVSLPEHRKFLLDMAEMRRKLAVARLSNSQVTNGCRFQLPAPRPSSEGVAVAGPCERSQASASNSRAKIQSALSVSAHLLKGYIVTFSTAVGVRGGATLEPSISPSWAPASCRSDQSFAFTSLIRIAEPRLWRTSRSRCQRCYRWLCHSGATPALHLGAR
jgi:hypothetical protein